MGEDWQTIMQRMAARQEGRERAQRAPREDTDAVRARQEAKAWLDQFSALPKLQGIREQVWGEGELITIDLIGQKARDRDTYRSITPTYHDLYGYALTVSFEQAIRSRNPWGRSDEWSKRIATSSLGVFSIRDAVRGRLLVVHSVIPAFVDEEERVETWDLDVLDSKDPERELVEWKCQD